MSDDVLQELLDRQAISDVVNRYATGIDRRQWDLYRSCFTDPVTIDFSSFAGEGEAETISVDDWVARVRGTLSGFDATHHQSSNHVHSIEGDDATCVSYMVAEHFLPNHLGDNFITLGGYYTNQLVRQEGEWKITNCKLTVTWNRGNRDLFRLAAERADKV